MLYLANIKTNKIYSNIQWSINKEYGKSMANSLIPIGLLKDALFSSAFPTVRGQSWLFNADLAEDAIFKDIEDFLKKYWYPMKNELDDITIEDIQNFIEYLASYQELKSLQARKHIQESLKQLPEWVADGIEKILSP
jgi:hypothetical protein